MGAHREIPHPRLTPRQWLRYRRLYRAMVVDAARKRELLNKDGRRQLKTESRRAARAVGR